ncbi:hypothetical protein ABIA33_002129 [Streptacidiphilus sp. MAP12-16]|uniref:DUF6296 family protein n=1 Tax=Streptacidiphilus sp. MAP12-16 TaxID=3156300 RepID=UPI003513B47D
MMHRDSPAFELTFAPAAVWGETPESDVLVVYRTKETGPGGHPVYRDVTGTVRAEISDLGEVRMLATGGHQAPRRPSACRALTSASAAETLRRTG